MNRFELFHAAMQQQLYGQLSWVIAAFSISTPGVEKKPYWIYSSSDAHRYYDPDTNEFVVITDADPAKPVYEWTDVITLEPAHIPNVTESIETTYGNWIVNWILLVEPFGTKIPYMEGDITPGRIEAYQLKDFRADPEAGVAKDPKAFYVSEYLNYVKGIYYLTGFTQVSVWAATEKTMLPPPGVAELRDRLLEENKDHLTELTTIAKIEKELVAFDDKWTAGDPGMNFLDDKKNMAARKKKFLISGAETGLTGSSTHGTLIKNSLIEGWDISNFPELNTSLRAASYSRGAETQLGGVSVKWLLRSSSNMNIAGTDCGSKLGVYVDITKKTIEKIVGFSIIEKGVSTFVPNEEAAGAYLGKKLMVRSPMYCQMPLTDFCPVCLGKRLSINKDGLSLAVSELGSSITLGSLKAAHGRALSTVKMNFLETIF